MLKLLEVAAIVGRQSHSSFDREFLHQVHGITRFGLLAIIRYKAVAAVFMEDHVKLTFEVCGAECRL